MYSRALTIVQMSLNAFFGSGESQRSALDRLASVTAQNG